MPKKVKNTTLSSPFELIAPHSCRGCGKLGTVLCDCCKKYIISSNFYNKCPKCQFEMPNKSKELSKHKCIHCNDFPPFYTIGSRTGLLADLIHDYKYNSTRAIGVKLAEMMNEKLPTILPSNTIIIPIPTSTRHVRERGFDHTLYIAKHLTKLNKSLGVNQLIVREKNTVQVGTDKNTRFIQANSAFSIKEKTLIDKSATYLLLDDVWTTGASMLSCIKKLRAIGAKHLIVALLSVSILDN